MGFVEYLEYLLDIRIEYNKHKRFPIVFYIDCLWGNTTPIVENLDKLLKKSPEEYSQKDLMSIFYILGKVKGKM